MKSSNKIIISRFALPLFLLFVAFEGLSQNDSVTVVTTPWEKVRIAKGITWKKHLYRGNLFGSNQSVNIVEIKRKKKIRFTIGYDKKLLRHTSEFGKEANALVAMNGTFFDMKEGGSVDFIKSDNEIINDNRLNKDARSVHQKAAVAMNGDKLRIVKWNGSADWEKTLSDAEVMVSGPLLIYHENTEPIDSSSFSVTRHPRTAVVTTSRSVLFITVDGRHENAAGMSLFELRHFLRWLNACDAINLDGGGSTTLWIHNQPDNGVVNYPSDNKRWDHFGERKVANVLLVTSTKAQAPNNKDQMTSTK